MFGTNTWVNFTACRRHGHIVANCMRKWTRRSRGWTNPGIACLHCHKVGHVIKDCKDRLIDTNTNPNGNTIDDIKRMRNKMSVKATNTEGAGTSNANGDTSSTRSGDITTFNMIAQVWNCIMTSFTMHRFHYTQFIL